MDRTEDISILHVEDDQAFADLAATVLEREDDRFAVEAVESAREGLARLADETFDCLISDYDMPGQNGIEFLRSVREDHPDLPFVLFTGKGSEEIASDAIAAGVTDYLQKEGGIDQFAILANRIHNAVDRTRVQREHRAVRERLEFALERTDSAVFQLDLETGEMSRHGAYDRLFGVQREGLSSWREFARRAVHPDDRGKFRQLYEGLTEGERRGGALEYRTNPDVAGVRWFRLSVAVETDADGGPRAVGLGRDITERKQRERTLQRLHGVSRDLLGAETKTDIADLITGAIDDALGYGINGVRYATDDGDELYIASTSEPVDGVLGERPNYPVGEGTAGRAYAEQETLVCDDVQSIDDGYDRGEARAGLYLPIGDHGTLSIMSTTPAEFDDADVRLAETFAANAEATLDRIQGAEELRAQNERLEQFTSLVSHDLRTPVNVASGRLALAREERDSEDLAEVDRALDRMEALIDDLLTLAREGELEEPAPIDLGDLVERCWTTVDVADATLVTEHTRRIVADRDRLQQLLENLLRNAVDHGGADVTVTVGELTDGFYVEDDGPGIPPADRTDIFEPGYSTAERGTGFGLRIVEQVATAHGWTVTATDGTGGGARFEITGVEFAD